MPEPKLPLRADSWEFAETCDSTQEGEEEGTTCMTGALDPPEGNGWYLVKWEPMPWENGEVITLCLWARRKSNDKSDELSSDETGG
jgi:hypothetical protein